MKRKFADLIIKEYYKDGNTYIDHPVNKCVMYKKCPFVFLTNGL